MMLACAGRRRRLHFDHDPRRVSRLATGSTHRIIAMAWTTPTLVEICIGLEINGYLPAEF
jgi:coenzyme PQQ precursor peptide PqqA